jgi:hypothetical protein
MATHFRLISRSAFLMSMAAAALPAQRQMVIGSTGDVFRYNGDTVWRERDSSLTRSIRHGDTIIEQRMHAAGWGPEEIRIVPRQPGEAVVAIGPDGKQHATATGPTNGWEGATRAIFTLAVLYQQNQARWLFPSDHEPLLSPETPRVYVVDSASRLVQYRDTVRVIKGCAGARHDTTTFLMFGGDSARRISSPERTFGIGVAQGLIGQMRRVLLEAKIRAYDSTALSDAPRAIDPCRH